MTYSDKSIEDERPANGHALCRGRGRGFDQIEKVAVPSFNALKLGLGPLAIRPIVVLLPEALAFGDQLHNRVGGALRRPLTVLQGRHERSPKAMRSRTFSRSMRRQGEAVVAKLGIGETDEIAWHTKPRPHATIGHG